MKKLRAVQLITLIHSIYIVPNVEYKSNIYAVLTCILHKVEELKRDHLDQSHRWNTTEAGR